MTAEHEPPFILAPHVEFREATEPAPLVLIVAMFPDGAEIVIPLTPAQARSAAATIKRFADDLDGLAHQN